MPNTAAARLNIAEESVKENQRKIEEFIIHSFTNITDSESFVRQIAKDLIYDCLTLTGGVLREINPEPNSEIRRRWQGLRSRAEYLLRQLTLLEPGSDEELQATLRWMSEKGSRLDLILLNNLTLNNLILSEHTNQLLVIVREKIKERLEAEVSPTQETVTKTYRIFAQASAFNNLPEIEILQSYSAFTIVRASEQVIDKIREKIPVENLEFQGNIEKDGVEETPASIPELHAELQQTGAQQMQNKIVKFKAPIQESWILRLKEIGARILQPAGGFDLIVAVPDDNVTVQIAGLEEVAKISPFVPNFRIRPQFLQNLEQEANAEKIVKARLKAASEGAKHQPSSIPLPGIMVADFFTPEDSQKAEATLRERGIKIIDRPTPTRLILDVSSQENVIDALRDISEQPGLQVLEEKTLPRLFNDVAREIIGKDVVASHPANIAGLGLTGKDEIIAVADSGLDTGEKSTLHPDFQERVNTIRSYPINTSYSSLMSNAGEDDGASDKYSGHGTHVAGSIIGDGKQAEAMGLSPIKGMAPEAELIFQAIEQTPQWTTAAILYYIQHTGKMPPASGLFGIPDDLKILFDEAYKYGARIHSNSWGGGDAGAYDTQCTDLDSFVWEHKDFLILVAAGNSGLNNLPNQGIEPMSIDSPSIAKNCVAVGASENDRLNTHKDTYGQWWEKSFLHPPFYDDSMTDNINDIVAFSSRGPCKTMRRKPDVIAPGTFILSTRSSTMPSNNFAWGAFHPAKAHYMYNGGTSMATPLVAGAAALLRQYFRMRTPLGNPTAALLKAALIHSAEYCNYRYKHASSTPWADNEQGWGRVNLVNVINPAHPTRAIFFDETGGLASGDEKTYRIEIDDDSVPLRATLVYNDYPGEQLINNLNLLLFAPDGEYFFGNDFIGNKQPDTLNNVEGIVIQSPQKGVWLIRVVASNIVVGPQDFALIVSGGNARLQ